MKKKRLIIAAFVLLAAIPAMAVFNEKDLSKTLSVLRYELTQEVVKSDARKGRIDTRDRSQHGQMVSVTKKCNELALMLYSQKQDYTFDMTYALKEVTKEYNDFTKRRMPYDEIISRLDIEIERYSRLVESLRRLPPQLNEIEDLPDSLAYHNDSLKINDIPAIDAVDKHPIDESVEALQHTVIGIAYSRDSLNANGHMHPFFLDAQSEEDRDTCLAYAVRLLRMYSDIKDRIVADNEHYEEASQRLEESFDYAQERYKTIQHRVFTQGQDNYLRVLKTLPVYASTAVEDAVNKYSSNLGNASVLKGSEWRGPIVFGFLLIVLITLAASILLSVVLVGVLRRCFKRLRNDASAKRRPVAVVLLGVVIFAICVGVVALVVDNNFFSFASPMLLIYAWMLAAILLSSLIRLDPERLSSAMKLFIPICVLGLLVITIRIIFVPNKLVNLVLPPVLIAFLIWQIVAFRRNGEKVEALDKVICGAGIFALAVAAVTAILGYIFLAIIIMIWWLFQVAAIETIVAIAHLLRRYEKGGLQENIKSYKKSHTVSAGGADVKGRFIKVTWMYDFVDKVVIPVAAILSAPLSIKLALDVFDMSAIFSDYYRAGFFDLVDAKGNPILKLSVYMIVLAVSLFFVFRYVDYAARAIYREARLSHLHASKGRYIHTNEVNLTLADNIISIIVWGTYIVMTFLLLRIPTGALSIVFAGLATGIGLAMKDILNNFIYGIQLMSGRLRVGDWMECDGIRGKVTAISYQSTQIETIDGAVMSFLNTALFSKNFKNLTRNNSYEFVKIGIGVGYGTDVEKVRTILLEALKSLESKDSFGRDIVDPSRGLTVALEDFGDSSVNLSVKQYVLVAERNSYMANAREAIYNALNANNIEIPFPQRDIHIIADNKN